MPRSVRNLHRGPIVAQDGEIGSIVDVYLDDQCWRVRYLVVDTGNPMPQREVLISPASISPARVGDDSIRVAMTRAEVEKSPDADTDRPVYLRQDLSPILRPGDEHLRSSAALLGYGIDTLDGAMGHLADFLIDDRTWAVTSLVIDTRNWLPGKHALVPPGKVARIDRPNRTIHLTIARAELSSSAPAIPGALS